MVRLFAGLARLTVLNLPLWFEPSMVSLDLLGLFLTGFDSIRD